MLEDASGGDVELFVSIINLSEVVYRVGKVRGEAETQETLALIRRFPLTVLPATEEAVWSAVGFKICHAISYAAAAAEGVGAPLVSGDPELAAMRGQVHTEKLERRT